MIRIFGDAIDDKIFPKYIKKFTQEERNIIDKFINSILREDKKSELEASEIEVFNDRADRITEEIYKRFTFKKIPFYLKFYKFYTNEKKAIDHLPSDKFDLFALVYDGHATTSGSPTKSLLKDFEDEKSITGIFVDGFANVPGSTGLDNLEFILKSEYPDYNPTTQLLGIRTRYEGDRLTDKCKNHLNKFHLKTIKNAILKPTK